ncbi:CASP-like protein 2B2 [Linum grandiflorum]
MSYLGVGVSPGNVPVYHGKSLKVIDRRVRVSELVLRCLTCVLGLVCIVLVVTDTQVKEFFSIQKKASYTDVKAMVFLVIANGIAAAYSFVQVVRCVVSMVRGEVLFNKPLAWIIFSGDQAMAYLTVAALAATIQSSVFAETGQAELQWMKTCDMYAKFCNRAGEGVGSAVLACLSMVLVSCISAFGLFRLYNSNNKAGKSEARW